MACVYCQNYEFSQSGQGREVEIKQLADFMLQLQGLKCHNINLVTPTHIMPQILKALVIAARCGLNIPLVYNTSGYERPESIKLLAGIVDIYLADIRYADETSAVKYSSSIAYPEFSRSSIKEMQRQVGIVKLDEEGIIKKGLVIRHLVLPQGISGTREVMKFLSEEISPDTYISLMSQYLPYYKAGSFPELARRISLKEYREAQVLMAEYGLHNGWTQGSYAQERFAGVHIKPGV
jgi:putative pyruvate formate lyase activating enzyme